MKNLFFVINQNPADGSAHGLYCLRNCWWLAAVEKKVGVHLVHPGRLSAEAALSRAGLSLLPNLHLHGLPCIRKAKGQPGLTVNAVYYWALMLFLRKRKKNQDILASASFPKLMRFLYRRKGLTDDLRRVYEVHQLALLERGPKAPESLVEQDVLSRSDTLLTTTQALCDHLERLVPGKFATNLGLACGFNPDSVPDHPETTPQPFTLAYIGSLYAEQGVQWLIRSWEKISRRVNLPIRLIVAGGTPAEVAALQMMTNDMNGSVHVHGPVHPRDLPVFLQNVDALIIPALFEGRMPYVALTKAYDYLGLNRPILAADLPSVAEVLRPEREALLFAPGSVEDLAKHLVRIIPDRQLKHTLVRNARERLLQFSWEVRSKRWWEAVNA